MCGADRVQTSGQTALWLNENCSFEVCLALNLPHCDETTPQSKTLHAETPQQGTKTLPACYGFIFKDKQALLSIRSLEHVGKCV